MKHIVNLPRFFLEILVIIGVTETLIMLVLPHLAPTSNELVSSFLDSALLVLLAGPVIVWRVSVMLVASETDTTAAIRRRESRMMSLFVLVCGLGITYSIAHWRFQANQAESVARFFYLSDRLQGEVIGRFDAVLFGLRGVRGLFVASELVHRREFRAIVESHRLSEEFPGVKGFGFVERVLRQDLDAFIRREQADEAKGFKVSNSGDAADLYVTKFIEPIEDNRRGLGVDVGNDQVLRQAAERSYETGEPVLSGQATVAMDTRVGPEFFYMMPVYRNGRFPQIPETRQENLVGVLLARVVARDLMANVTEVAEHKLDVVLIDGHGEVGARVIFDSRSDLAPNDPVPELSKELFVKSYEMSVGGHPLTLRVTVSPFFKGEIDESIVPVIAVSGVLFSILGSLVVWLLGSGRARALALAELMTHDLAAAKLKAEAALRETEALVNTLHQHAIVLVADWAGNITDVNEAFCRISGYSRPELIGQNFREVTFGQGAEDDWQDAWYAISAGRSWRGVVRNQTKSGAVLWLDSVIAPFLDADHRVEKYVSIHFDVTEEKWAGEELQRHRDHLSDMVEAKTEELVLAKDAVEKASKAKSEFFASVSHELRTPLHGILAFSDLGRKKYQSAPAEKLLEYFTKIHTSGDNMLRLVDDLLTLAKFDAGKMEFRFARMDLRVLVHELVQELSALCLEKSIRIEIRPTTTETALECDAFRIAQVIRNILANAIRFSPPNGNVLVELQTLTLPLTRHEEPQPVLQVGIHDQGPGIPADDLTQIFDEFVQSHAVKIGGGTGSGLPICRRIVGIHHGRIWAENRAEGGASLYFQLPYSLQHPQGPNT